MLGAALAGLTLLAVSACRQPPEPPRGVDENPPVEDIVEETVEAAPETVRVLLQTDWLVVTEIHLAAGGEIALHREGERAVFAHNAHTLRLSPLSGEGSATSRSFRAGQAGLLPAGPLDLEAAGAREARLVVVNRSSQPLPPEAGAGPGLAGAAGARELLRDGPVRVSALTLDGGASHEIRDAPLEAVYVLGPGSLRISGGGAARSNTASEPGASEPVTLLPGQALGLVGRSTAANPGGAPTRLVVFRFER